MKKKKQNQSSQTKKKKDKGGGEEERKKTARKKKINYTNKGGHKKAQTRSLFYIGQLLLGVGLPCSIATPRATPLEKVDFPFSRYHFHIGFRLQVELCIHFSVLDLVWSGPVQVWHVLCRVQVHIGLIVTGNLCYLGVIQHLHFICLLFIVDSWAVGEGFNEDIPFRTKCPKSLSLCMSSSCVSLGVFTASLI